MNLLKDDYIYASGSGSIKTTPTLIYTYIANCNKVSVTINCKSKIESRGASCNELNAL